MTLYPKIYCDFVQGVYYANGVFYGVDDLLQPYSPGGFAVIVDDQGLLVDDATSAGQSFPITTATWDAAMALLGTDLVGVIKYTPNIPEDNDYNSNYFAFRPNTTPAQYYCSAVSVGPPFAAFVDFVTAGGAGQAENTNAFNTAVFGTKSLVPYLSLNGAATVSGTPGGYLTTHGQFGPAGGDGGGSGEFHVSFIAFYDATPIPPEDFPALGANPPPPPTGQPIPLGTGFAPIPTPLPCIPCCTTAAPLC